MRTKSKISRPRSPQDEIPEDKMTLSQAVSILMNPEVEPAEEDLSGVLSNYIFG